MQGIAWSKVGLGLVALIFVLPTQVLGENMRPSDALIQNARVKASEGDKEGAAALYHRALQFDDSNKEARCELASLLIDVYAAEPEAEQFEVLALIDQNIQEPTCVAHNFPLTFLNNGALNTADVSMGKSVLLILQKLQNNDNAGAFKLAEKLKKQHPSHPVPYNLLGLAWQGLGNLSQARESFQKALALQEDFYAARVNLAELELHLGEFKMAHQELDTVLKQENNHRRASLVKAQLYDLEGHPEVANEWYSKISEAF